MFSEGDGYEQFMGRWSRLLAPLFVDFAQVGRGDAVLDVGSGTGALSLAVAAVTSARVTGIERSEAFVRYAQSTPSDRVRFQVGDATALPFPDDTFDRTLSMLVLNFVPDPAVALDQMIRVTRPGGVVAAAVWDYGDGMGMLRMFWDEAVALNPDAEPRDERHMPLCSRGALAELWRDHGLHDVDEQALDDRDGVPVVRRLLAAVPARPGPGRCVRDVVERIRPARTAIEVAPTVGGFVVERARMGGAGRGHLTAFANIRQSCGSALMFGNMP